MDVSLPGENGIAIAQQVKSVENDKASVMRKLNLKNNAGYPKLSCNGMEERR